MQLQTLWYPHSSNCQDDKCRAEEAGEEAVLELPHHGELAEVRWLQESSLLQCRVPGCGQGETRGMVREKGKIKSFPTEAGDLQGLRVCEISDHTCNEWQIVKVN